MSYLALGGLSLIILAVCCWAFWMLGYDHGIEDERKRQPRKNNHDHW